MGQDSQTETQGYIIEQEIPTFKLVKQNGQELSLQGQIPEWESNGVFIIESSIETLELAPESYTLSEAYPNPFNPVTTIGFTVPIQSDVSFYIYDIHGRKIRHLGDKVYAQGYHTISWDASDVSSGVYFVQMSAGSFYATQKLILIK